MPIARSSLFLIASILWVLGLLWTPISTSADEGYSATFPAMGTLVTIQVYAPSEAEANDVCRKSQAEVERLVGLLSDYDMSSEISLLSQATLEEWHDTSDDVWEVLVKSDEWYRQSHGNFDASLGSLTRLWRKGRKEKKMPDAEQVAMALQHAGWNKVLLDPDKRAIKLLPPGVLLDFGAIAKGYIVDRTFTIIHSQYPSCLVRAGGDMRCGEPPPGLPGWRIAVGKIKNEEGDLEVMSLKNCSVASSGDLFQFLEWEGKRFSHVLDPATGQPLEGPRMATIVTQLACDADACATALCGLGNEKGFAMLEKRPGVEARYAWYPEGSDQVSVQKTPGFPEVTRVASEALK